MTIDTIHARLAARFPNAIAPLQPVEAGAPWIAVDAAALPDVCRFLRDEPDLHFDNLRLLTGLDRQPDLSSVYHLYSYTHFHDLTLRVDVPRESPHVPSVADVWPAANWYEREAFDLLGIVYDGHPELRRILLPLDWEGHPLRKDYEPPREYHGIAHDG